MTLPVTSDLPTLLTRLRTEERARQAELARLEARLREFEDVERQAYARWLRHELGPVLAILEARRDELRARRATAERVMALADQEGWHPREALYVVLNPRSESPPARRDRMDPDEVAARRRAKVDRKRAERKAARRATPDAAMPGDGVAASSAAPRSRRIAVYRAVARRLHPDSPTVVRFLDPSRAKALWVEATIAYTAGNLERLLSIAAWLDASEEGDADPIVPSSLSERYERLRALTRSTRALERRLESLADDPAWEFSLRTPRDRRRLRAAAAQMLDEEMELVDAALAAAADFLAAIGSPRPPRRSR
ncbi:MAG TPA: hypothetical protein VGR62_22085 [Candidatus Binatia bacterium]|nr:hypothetical protein [Candidatus Binatia bacterium]